MKNKLWSLYRSLLNTQYGISAMKQRYLRERKRVWEPILLVLVLVPFAIATLRLLWKLTEMLFVAGLGFGQPPLGPRLRRGIRFAAHLVFWFLLVAVRFLFQHGLGIFGPPLPPLKSGEILLLKLAVVLTGKYALNAFILFPPIWLRYGLLARWASAMCSWPCPYSCFCP